MAGEAIRSVWILRRSRPDDDLIALNPLASPVD